MREKFIEINIKCIIVCMVLNLIVMDIYSPLEIFISNLLTFLIVNLIFFIVWKVEE